MATMTGRRTTIIGVFEDRADAVAPGETMLEGESHYYQREFESGRTIVTVKAGNRYDEVVTILHRNGGYDLDTEVSRPTITTATTETTVQTTTAATVGPAPYPQTPGEMPAVRHPAVNADLH